MAEINIWFLLAILACMWISGYCIAIGLTDWKHVKDGWRKSR